MAKKLAKKLVTSQRSKWLKLLAQNGDKSETGKDRVLVDTNVWYSAILYGGKPEQLIRFCKHNCYVITSKYLVDELLAQLKSQKTPYKWRNALEQLLKRLCIMVEPDDLPEISRDPKDDPVLATAIVGSCDYLITGDEDLLVIKMYDGLQIVSPAGFLERKDLI